MKETVEFLHSTEVAIQNLELVLKSKESNTLAWQLLLKIPFCRNVRLKGSFMNRQMSLAGSTLDPKILLDCETEAEKHLEVEILTENSSKGFGETLSEFLNVYSRLNSLKRLELFCVNLQLINVEKLGELRNRFLTYVQTREEFTLVLEKSLHSLRLLLSLAGNDNCAFARIVDFTKQPSDHRFSITYKRGTLRTLDLSFNISFRSYKKIRDICQPRNLSKIDSINCRKKSLYSIKTKIARGCSN